MPPTTMTEDGGKRVILKNSEGNKKAEAGKHIFSASKRDSLSALQYQNVKQRRSPWDSSKRQRRHARSLKKSTAPLLNAIGLSLEKPPPRKPGGALHQQQASCSTCRPASTLCSPPLNLACRVRAGLCSQPAECLKEGNIRVPAEGALKRAHRLQ